MKIYHQRFKKTPTGKHFGGRHYGTLEAGKQRLAKIKENMEAYLGPGRAGRILGPIVVEEAEMASGAKIYKLSDPLNELTGDYKILEIKDSPQRGKLEEEGYQGVAYINAVEDPGSVSFLIWDEKAVVPLKKSYKRSKRSAKPEPAGLRGVR